MKFGNFKFAKKEALFFLLLFAIVYKFIGDKVWAAQTPNRNDLVAAENIV